MNIVSTNKFNINYDGDLNIQVEQFWQVESYGTLKPYDRENMTKEEKKGINILEKTKTKRENR